MDVRITVETIFEDGKTRKHALGIWSRPFRKMSGEAIGLMLEDAKAIVAQLQKAIVQDQVEEMSQACRPCPGCERVRPIHDYRSRTLDTMFGRFSPSFGAMLIGFITLGFSLVALMFYPQSLTSCAEISHPQTLICHYSFPLGMLHGFCIDFNSRQPCHSDR